MRGMEGERGGKPGESRQMRGMEGELSAQAFSMLSGTLSTKRCPMASEMKSAAAISVRSSRNVCPAPENTTKDRSRLRRPLLSFLLFSFFFPPFFSFHCFYLFLNIVSFQIILEARPVPDASNIQSSPTTSSPVHRRGPGDEKSAPYVCRCRSGLPHVQAQCTSIFPFKKVPW